MEIFCSKTSTPCYEFTQHQQAQRKYSFFFFSQQIFFSKTKENSKLYLRDFYRKWTHLFPPSNSIDPNPFKNVLKNRKFSSKIISTGAKTWLKF